MGRERERERRIRGSSEKGVCIIIVAIYRRTIDGLEFECESIGGDESEPGTAEATPSSSAFFLACAISLAFLRWNSLTRFLTSRTQALSSSTEVRLKMHLHFS